MNHYNKGLCIRRTGRRVLRGSAAIYFGLAALGSGLMTISIVGCGGVHNTHGSNAAGSLPSSSSGRAVLTITWPDISTTRLIPTAANSVNVRVLSADRTQVLGESLIVRPNGGGTSTALFDQLPLGNAVVAATAYPNVDGSGTAQAQAQTSIAIVADQIIPVYLTMGSTIVSLDASLNPTVLTTGATVIFTVTPRDGNGNVVLTTPSTLRWASSDADVASVDATGKVMALSAGGTTITATEIESGKTVSIALTVSKTPLAADSQSATAYQINPGHSGSITFNQTLNFPSNPTWTITLPGASSYPIIAGGRIFVTCRVQEGYGTQLYAFDKVTGQPLWGPVSLGGTHNWSGLTYDKGKVFTINFDGVLRSFDAATGTPGWSIQLPGQYAFTAAPTAVNGIVYTGGAGSGGTLYAVSETDGDIVWKTPVENGDQSSPAVATNNTGASTGVFVSYPCQVYGFNPNTGAPQWHYDGPCYGGGGKTSVYQNGYLYVRDYDRNGIFDAHTGTQVGTFDSSVAPAIGATMGFYQSGGTLQGVALNSNQVAWSFTGDGSLTSAPILIDQTVVVGSKSGKVYALNSTNGSVVWTGTATAAIDAPDEHNVIQPLTGLSAGEGYLVVPAGSTLTAWHIAGQ